MWSGFALPHLQNSEVLISILISDEDFAFFSCAVSPGFDFADFVLSKKSELLGKFPQHAQIIQAFCRDE